MRRALPLLGHGPFLAINADILCDYPLATLRACHPAGLAHLVMVTTPAWKATGDFELRDGALIGRGNRSLTFAGIGVYRPELVRDCADLRFSTVPLLEAAMARGEVTGEQHAGAWQDIGTPQRLDDARKIYSINY
ncbi:MAG: hypothetical protein AAGE01_19075 [Pseudomonadota bacterium]